MWSRSDGDHITSAAGVFLDNSSHNGLVDLLVRWPPGTPPERPMLDISNADRESRDFHDGDASTCDGKATALQQQMADAPLPAQAIRKCRSLEQIQIVEIG